MILAAVMAKLGTYGIIRFDLSLFPRAVVDLAPLLLTLGVVGILYGAIVACATRDLKRLVAEEGRVPQQVLILPGLSPVIGSTEAEAHRIARELNDLSDPEVGRKRLSGRFGRTETGIRGETRF